jgi:trimethylguanosine synthase
MSSKDCSNSPFGPDTQRYWEGRYSLFSKFDFGIEIDREGLFSVKPETVALRIASRLHGTTVLDGFCGVGGSAIGFARAGKKVTTVDIDVARLGMARKNAAIYGVEEQIEFIHTDIADILSAQRKFDGIYFDPPWGGPDYYKADLFSFSMFSPNGQLLLEAALARDCNVGFTLPKNFDLNELGSFKRDFFLEWNRVGNSAVFSTAYFEGCVDGSMDCQSKA